MSIIKREKDKLREEYKSVRKNIKNKKGKSKEIVSKIIKTRIFKDAKIIALYKSLKSEVDTTEVIEYAINDGKIVVLPKVENDELKFYKINSIDEILEKGRLGIEEPKGKIENLINNNLIDLLVVPGLCFDLEKNRLGFGKGFYDRFLKQKEFKTIGICFEDQVVEKLPIDEYDEKVIMIITDKRCIE